MKSFGRVAASVLQLGGIAAALMFFLFGLAHRNWSLIAAAAFCVLLHLIGDAGRKFLEIPDTNSVLAAASQFVKIRPFLTFVGIMLMLIGHYTHIDLTLGRADIVTSNGLLLLGFAFAIIGAINYSVIYNSEDKL
jgi:hypothetical protein